MAGEAIVEKLNGNWPPCCELLGARTLAFDPKDGELTTSWAADERFCHSGDVLQGGFATAMLDATMAYAALAHDGEIAYLPSLEIKVSFLSPGRPGRLICMARPVQLGGSVGFLEGELRQDSSLVATATSTAKLIRQRSPNR